MLHIILTLKFSAMPYYRSGSPSALSLSSVCLQVREKVSVATGYLLLPFKTQVQINVGYAVFLFFREKSIGTLTW